MWIGRMKGVFCGLKVTQVSLILIGFVCLAVLALALNKTTLIASLNVPQSRFLHLTPGQDSNHKYDPEEKSNPEQLEKNVSIVEQINFTRTSSSASIKENRSSDNVAANKQDTAPSVTDGAGAEVLENTISSKVGDDENVGPDSLGSETYTADSSAKVEYVIQKVNGSSMTLGLYILGSVVSSGCQQCGLAA